MANKNGATNPPTQHPSLKTQVYYWQVSGPQPCAVNPEKSDEPVSSDPENPDPSPKRYETEYICKDERRRERVRLTLGADWRPKQNRWEVSYSIGAATGSSSAYDLNAHGAILLYDKGGKKGWEGASIQGSKPEEITENLQAAWKSVLPGREDLFPNLGAMSVELDVFGLNRVGDSFEVGECRRDKGKRKIKPERSKDGKGHIERRKTFVCRNPGKAPFATLSYIGTADNEKNKWDLKYQVGTETPKPFDPENQQGVLVLREGQKVRGVLLEGKDEEAISREIHTAIVKALPPPPIPSKSQFSKMSIQKGEGGSFTATLVACNLPGKMENLSGGKHQKWKCEGKNPVHLVSPLRLVLEDGKPDQYVLHPWEWKWQPKGTKRAHLNAKVQKGQHTVWLEDGDSNLPWFAIKDIPDLVAKLTDPKANIQKLPEKLNAQGIMEKLDGHTKLSDTPNVSCYGIKEERPFDVFHVEPNSIRRVGKNNNKFKQEFSAHCSVPDGEGPTVTLSRDITVERDGSKTVIQVSPWISNRETDEGNRVSQNNLALVLNGQDKEGKPRIEPVVYDSEGEREEKMRRRYGPFYDPRESAFSVGAGPTSVTRLQKLPPKIDCPPEDREICDFAARETPRVRVPAEGNGAMLTLRYDNHPLAEQGTPWASLLLSLQANIGTATDIGFIGDAAACVGLSGRHLLGWGSPIDVSARVCPVVGGYNTAHNLHLKPGFFPVWNVTGEWRWGALGLTRYDVEETWNTSRGPGSDRLNYWLFSASFVFPDEIQDPIIPE